MFAIKTHLIKSIENNDTIPGTVAPRTFRIPISLVRLKCVKEANPNSPRHETNIDINENVLNNCAL